MQPVVVCLIYNKADNKNGRDENIKSITGKVEHQPWCHTSMVNDTNLLVKKNFLKTDFTFFFIAFCNFLCFQCEITSLST